MSSKENHTLFLGPSKPQNLEQLRKLIDDQDVLSSGIEYEFVDPSKSESVPKSNELSVSVDDVLVGNAIQIRHQIREPSPSIRDHWL